MKKPKGPPKPMATPTCKTYVSKDIVNVIDLDIIKEVGLLAPMTINIHLKVRISRWQRFRLWLGINLIVLGARTSGLPMEINTNSEVEDGRTEDQGQ